jgi:hypothetical protein
MLDVAYSFEIIRPGHARLTLVKDREHRIREHLEANRAADIVTTGDHDHLHLEIREPTGTFKPTEVMERVSRFLELQAKEANLTRIEAAVNGKGTTIRAAVEALVAEGWISVRSQGVARLHQSVRPFRADEKAQAR